MEINMSAFNIIRNRSNAAYLLVFLLVFLILTFSFFLLFGQEKKLVLEYQNICVSGICLGDKSEKLYLKLGSPDSIIEYNNPIIIKDSSKFFYYLNSCFEVVDNKIQTFSIQDSSIRGTYPKIQIGEHIVDFLEKYPQLVFNSYVPTDEEYYIYSTIVDDMKTFYSGEYRIVVKNDTITKFYYWIPY